MSFEVIIPNAGESVSSANDAQWHVADGASVSKGDILLTIETDKVSSELESEEVLSCFYYHIQSNVSNIGHKQIQ